MSKRQRRHRERRKRHEQKQRKLLVNHERLAQAPQIVTASVLTVGLAGQVLAPAPCDRPCANAHSGGAALMITNIDIDTVPTRINWTPVISVQTNAGTALPRST
jgi:hypothetical protein